MTIKSRIKYPEGMTKDEKQRLKERLETNKKQIAAINLQHSHKKPAPKKAKKDQ